MAPFFALCISLAARRHAPDPRGVCACRGARPQAHFALISRRRPVNPPPLLPARLRTPPPDAGRFLHTCPGVNCQRKRSDIGCITRLACALSPSSSSHWVHHTPGLCALRGDEGTGCAVLGLAFIDSLRRRRPRAAQWTTLCFGTSYARSTCGPFPPALARKGTIPGISGYPDIIPGRYPGYPGIPGICMYPEYPVCPEEAVV